jgi:formyl-CoA transferase/CoA:oxalate CoA-transferase
MWRSLARCLDRETWLDDPRFADGGGRLRHREVLSSGIEGGLATADVADWVERLNAAGVPCGPMLDLEQVFANPQVLARGMRVELPHPERGTFVTTGLPIKLSATPGAIARRPPLHGEHDAQVLRECGLAAEEIATLRARGVVGAAG